MVYVESITAKNETRTIRDLNGQQMLATIEASTTASKAYAVGDYLIANDKIYKVTAAIASGGTITVGTNVAEAKVGTELTELNRQLSESITPAIEEIETALDGKAPVIINTASGDIASFSDGADGMPVKSLVANIEPVQDLHGYDYPWPAGGGKNLFGGSYNELFELHIPSGTTICAYCENIATINYYGADGQTRIDYWTASSAGRVFTLTADAYYFRFNGAEGKTPTKMYIAIESAFSGYLPYSNICPISGHTGAEVTRTGVNLFDEVLEVGRIEPSTGQNSINSNLTRSKNYIPIPQGANLYLLLPWAEVFWYRADKTYIGYNVHKVSEDGAVHGGIITPPNDACYMRFRCSGSYGTTYKNNISINYPSTDTSYHAYEGNQISIAFPTEAGTVYGGTLDVTNGVLTVDRAMVTLDGTNTILNGYFASNGNRILGFATDNIIHAGTGQNANLVTSYTISRTADSQYSNGDLSVAVSSAGGVYGVYLCIPGTTSNEEIIAYLTATPLQVVYPLNTTVTYQLTPQELDTLLGTNNVWADTGDIAECEYPADTKLYIDGKIAEAIANALNA